MNTATSNLLQSKYFTPVFNTAIFDGPLRMYFAQHQEPEALKVYFRLQEMVHRVCGNGVTVGADSDSQIFIMLYPNEETFFQSFERTDTSIVENFGEHLVMGLRGPVKDEELDVIATRLESGLSTATFLREDLPLR